MPICILEVCHDPFGSAFAAALVFLLTFALFQSDPGGPATRIRVDDVVGLNQRVIEIVESCTIEGGGTAYAHLSCDIARRFLLGQ